MKKLIELSGFQRTLAAEGRMEELLASAALRDELFSRLDLTCDSCRHELEPLARELAESDAALSEAIQSIRDNIGAKLGQVKTGMSALKAYGRY